jgi:hypothetical protein
MPIKTIRRYVYDPISIMPAGDLLAVYQETVNGKDEACSHPITCLAVCRVIEYLFRVDELGNNLNPGMEGTKGHEYNRVCGMELGAEGDLFVCDEMENFLGLIRAGESANDLLLISRGEK